MLSLVQNPVLPSLFSGHLPSFFTRQRTPGTAHCNPLKLKAECNNWYLPLFCIAYCVYVMQHINTDVL
jgi:hypothetical protein